MKVAKLLLAMMTIIAFTVPASAEMQIAAQHDYFTGGSPWMQPFYPTYVIAQTFVPTVSGTLSSIDATVQRNFSGPDPNGIPISFEIRSVYDSGINGWQPDFSVPALATGSVSATDPLLNDYFINWVNVPMTAFELQAGQMYALVASAVGTGDWNASSPESYDWYCMGFDGSAYPSGNLLIGYSGDTILANQVYDVPFRVWVGSANQPPVLNVSAAPTAGVVGTQITFQATATDPDADALTFSLANAPTGAAIDPTTGNFTWMPNAAGTFSFKVVATDTGGLSDSKQLSIVVSALQITDAAARGKNKNVQVVVQIGNPGTTTAHDVTVTVVTLDGVNTISDLPMLFGTIKPGENKKCTLQFKAKLSGPQTLTINGTSSLGTFVTSQTVDVQ